MRMQVVEKMARSKSKNKMCKLFRNGDITSILCNHDNKFFNFEFFLIFHDMNILHDLISN
jgi:hypothetical protein